MNSNCETLPCTRTNGSRHSYWARLLEWWNATNPANEAAESRRELAALGDHLLRDIGIDPCTLKLTPSTGGSLAARDRHRCPPRICLVK